MFAFRNDCLIVARADLFGASVIRLVTSTSAVSRTNVKAAQYLRTSTLAQPYSIDAQKRSIREYAHRHGFEIVRTYADHGRSGLTLGNRHGLSALLRDVAYGYCEYQAVLVYDVSRWGRFQDADEAAHYEFLCKAFGIPVHYCAEPFINDGNLPTFILKSLKRTMAAEYSRELSLRTFRGQKHLSEKGFRTGGPSGYGLRRVAISENGARTQILRAGELKSISSDRVVLVPGPGEEVKVVRKIFAMAAQSSSYAAIASELNANKVPYKPGRAWADYVVEGILKNKKYAGWHVWNRTTGRLGINRRRNPTGEWVVVPNAFQPVVNLSAYNKAQSRRPNGYRWTDEELLRELEQVRLGCLESVGPSIATLRRRLLGMPCLRSRRGTSPVNPSAGGLSTRQRVIDLRNQVLDNLSALFSDKVSEFHLSRKSRPLLKLANGRIVSVIVCARVLRKTGIMRWMFRPIAAETNFVTLICLQFPRHTGYYLVPRIPLPRNCFIGTNHAILKTGVRLNGLSEFYEATAAFIGPSKGST